MRPIFMFERAKALNADCAPGPGVLVLLPPVARNLMCNAVIPSVLHFSATSYKYLLTIQLNINFGYKLT